MNELVKSRPGLLLPLIALEFVHLDKKFFRNFDCSLLMRNFFRKRKVAELSSIALEAAAIYQ